MPGWRFRISPWCSADYVPPEWTAQIAIHYAHRVGALIVTLAIAATVGHVWYHHAARAGASRPALLLSCLVLAQVTLGAFVIWSGKNVAINTAHVVVGALTLATSLVLTLRSHRVRFGDDAAAAVRVRRPDGSEPGSLRGARVKECRRVPIDRCLDRAALRRFSRAHETSPEFSCRRHGRGRVLPRRGRRPGDREARRGGRSASRSSPGAPRASTRFTSARRTA